MKRLAVAIYDSKAAVFTEPVLVLSGAQAVRSFSDSVNSGKSDYALHPEDYTLFALGYFDDCTGEFECMKPGPESLAIAITLKRKEV